MSGCIAEVRPGLLFGFLGNIFGRKIEIVPPGARAHKHHEDK